MIKTKSILKKIFKNQIWDIPNPDHKIYLTFDDGPIPEVTEWVLDILKNENIKATFFCIGENIQKHPEIFKKIMNDGHSIGNHTFNHLNGWKTKNEDYMENLKLYESEHLKLNTENSFIFRPPYGKIKPSQSKKIREKGYNIIMWDVLSKDYDPKTTPEKCLKNVIKHTQSGSIIVFHDSIKANHNLKFALPRTIQILKEKGYVFDVIRQIKLVLEPN